ncbi:pentatricopeptide repeat-containing protein [Acrasis kona]|uniref:Pentatricopeptide repeat-containing protein n=1 Tax=Acrasis kona TaxID=1008807 RepID=A0AAW2Z6M5_9EUKA
MQLFRTPVLRHTPRSTSFVLLQTRYYAIRGVALKGKEPPPKKVVKSEEQLERERLEKDRLERDKLFKTINRTKLTTKKKKQKKAKNLKEVDEEVVSKDSKIFNNLVTRHFESNNFESGEEAFETMREEGILPSRSTIISMIKGYGRDNHLDEARSLYNSAVMKFGILVDDEISATMLNAYLSNNKGKEAEKLMKVLSKQTLGPHCVCCLIDDLFRKHQPEDAKSMYDSMEDDIKNNNNVLMSMVSGYCSINDYNKARDMIKLITDQYISKDATEVIKVVFDHSIKEGDILSARSVFDKTHKALKSYGYNKMIAMYIEKNDKKGADELIAQMRASGMKPSPGLERKYESFVYMGLNKEERKEVDEYLDGVSKELKLDVRVILGLKKPDLDDDTKEYFKGLFDKYKNKKLNEREQRRDIDEYHARFRRRK